MSKEKRIPAIKGQIGIWLYYSSVMRFDDICEYVKRIDTELHQSKMLSDMIQRSISKNYKSIANYIKTQDERFFNSIILAVYDGSPTWNAIRIIDEKGNDNYNLGVLTLTGNEKLFPVDGQHRVEGIKAALKDDKSLADEEVPVILIGHKNTIEGMQRTRRLFSTLNRYAKPVSIRDIIALDEDDIAAIATRYLLEDSKVFSEGRVLNSRSKSIPDKERKAIISIIALYECNQILLSLFIENLTVKNVNDNVIKSKKEKLKEYCKHRPDDDTIEEFNSLCVDYWKAILSGSKEYLINNNGSVGEYRDGNGGHVFFRPAMIIAFTKAVVRIKSITNNSFEQIVNSFPDYILWLKHPVWDRIAWDSTKNKMVERISSTLVELIFVYIYNKDFLSDKELFKLNDSLNSCWRLEKDSIIQLNTLLQQ